MKKGIIMISVLLSLVLVVGMIGVAGCLLVLKDDDTINRDNVSIMNGGDTYDAARLELVAYDYSSSDYSSSDYSSSDYGSSDYGSSSDSSDGDGPGKDTTPESGISIPFIPRLSNFATTIGEFDDITYYCRPVCDGDVVTLKVSTSEMGDMYGLDYHKITVEYEVEGAEVIRSGYDYNGSPLYKDGIATDFVLASGFNKIVAKIYYNRYYVGAFDPFYTYVP